MYKATNEEHIRYTKEKRRDEKGQHWVICETCKGTGYMDIDGLPFDCPICSDGEYPGYRRVKE